MQVRYEHIKKITLEFAQEVEDEHLILLKSQVVVLTINFSVDMQLNLIMWYILHLMWDNYLFLGHFGVNLIIPIQLSS